MAIKKRTIKGKPYYYLERNLRVGDTEWKTFSIYLGSKKPHAKQLHTLEKRLGSKINQYILDKILKTDTQFIDKETALLLERIKTSHKKILGALDKTSRANYLKRIRETFITNTNAIEGSRLTLEQTKKILELRDKYDVDDVEELEVVNMEHCLELYDELLEKKIELDEKIILRFHLLLLKTIPKYEAYAGIWRPVKVYIRGSKYDFPHWKRVPKLMSNLLAWYQNNKNKTHPVELAAKFHAKFVTIHPFADGNGRMARLLMNYIIQLNGFPFTDVSFSKRDEYFETQELAHFGNYKNFVLFLVQEIKAQFKDLKRKIKIQIFS
ncbi:Fic family protein [Candidatus Micrarchaeota archaeon]|nr:Fic family protein [Candidatus Micrarchaeota archaeon]